MHSRSQRKRGMREEERVLMKGDIGKSHITTGVRKVYSVALMCPRVANKHAFESTRGAFREGIRVILDKDNTSKNSRRKGEEG